MWKDLEDTQARVSQLMNEVYGVEVGGVGLDSIGADRYAQHFLGLFLQWEN